MFGGEEASVDEVAERHERTAIADFLHHLSGEGLDFGVVQLAIAIPGGGVAGGGLERAGELGQHGAADGRAVGQGLATHAGEYGLPGVLRRGVHVEASVVEGIAREVGRVREFVGRREGAVGDGRTVVGLEDDALVGQRVIACFQSFLDRLERSHVEGSAIAGGFLEGVLLVRGDIGVRREVCAGREWILFAGKRVGGRLEVQPAEVIGVPEREVSGEGVVGAHIGEITDNAGAFVDRDVAIFRNGLIVAGFELRAGPVGNLGEVHDARVGEGRTHGEVGVGIDLGRSGGAELREGEQWAPGNREEHRVAALRGHRADAIAPIGIVIIGRERDLRLGVQAALREHPADRRVRLAVVTEEVGLLRTYAQEVRRHRGGVHFRWGRQVGDPASVTGTGHELEGAGPRRRRIPDILGLGFAGHLG